LGAKVETYYLATDPHGYTHRILFDGKDVWGAENLMHFVEGTKEEKRILLDNFLRSMLNSKDEEGSYFEVNWRRE
jgi:hypothetical protein